MANTQYFEPIDFTNYRGNPLNDTNLNLMQKLINEGIQKAIDQNVPIGTGRDYFGTTAPENYMFADGSAISRIEYSELFKVIGTTCGSGDGSTTFNLPDKREAVTIMKGSTYKTLGAITGANTKAISKDNLPNTGLGIKYQNYPITYNSDANSTFNNNKRAIGFDTNDQTTQSHLVTEALGSGTKFNVMQKTLVCNYIIKVK